MQVEDNFACTHEVTAAWYENKIMLCGSRTQMDNLSCFLFYPQFTQGKNIWEWLQLEVEHVLAPVVKNKLWPSIIHTKWV